MMNRSFALLSVISRQSARSLFVHKRAITSTHQHSKEQKSSSLGKWGLLSSIALMTTFSIQYAQKKEVKTIKQPRFSKEEVTVVFVLGGPGAGKGTQCAKLVSDFGFIHLSAGDLLREERNREGSEVGELINNYIKEGKIVPMEITISLLQKAMEQSGGKRFLIDGFPRKVDQGIEFEETVCESKFVLNFDCPEEEMERRLLKRGETSGRIDDNIDSIRKRFQTHVKDTMPVIDFYGSQNKVYTVSCLQSIDMVYSDVKKIFEEMFQNKK